MDATDQHDVHVAAARRAFRRFCAWLLAAGGPGIALVLGPVAWELRYHMIVQFGGTVLAAVAALGARRARHTLDRHRAALLARGVATSWSGLPLPGPGGVGGDRRAAAARIALRTHALVVTACTALLAATVAAWTCNAASSVGPGPPNPGVWAIGPAVAGLLGLWSRSAVSRVEPMSPGGRLDRRRGQAGVLLFVLVLLACGIGAQSLRSARLAAEPPRIVSATISECTVGAKTGRRCTGRWELDGRAYTGRVPHPGARKGEVLQIEVAASRPDVVLPVRDPAPPRFAPVLGIAAVVPAAVWWLGCARSLRRALRSAAVRPGGLSTGRW